MITSAERERINQKIGDVVRGRKPSIVVGKLTHGPKRNAAATNGDGAGCSPQNGAESNGGAVSLQAASQAMEETIKRALLAAGVKTEAEFKALSKSDQNAFLAQASGQIRTGVDPNEERKVLDPALVFPSPWNRTGFTASGMEKITESIRLHGVLQDGVVRPAKRELLTTLVEKVAYDGFVAQGLECWELIIGERRWRGASAAGRMFPAKVRRNCTDEDAIELQAIENLQREDPNPIDEAEKFQQLLDVYAKRGLTKEAAIIEIQKRVGGGRVEDGPSRSAIYDSLRLLKLPPEAKGACRDGMLPPSHARELSKLEEDRDELLAAFKLVMKKPPGVERDEDEHWREIDRDSTGLMSFRDTATMVARRIKYVRNRRDFNKKKAEFEKAGLRVLTDKESGKVIAGENSTGTFSLEYGQKEFVKGDATCSLQGANYKSYKDLWKEAPPQVLAMTPRGRAVVIYEIEKANQAVKAGGKLKKQTSTRHVKTAEEIERERAMARRESVAMDVLRCIGRDEPNKETRPGFMRFVAAQLIDSLAYRLEAISKLRGLANGYDLAKLIPELSENECRALILQIVAVGEESDYLYGREDRKGYTAICKHVGVSLDKLEKEAVKREEEEATAAPVQASGRKGKK
jgi:ParB/RepB/Spo0J family partition protein